MSHDHVNSLMIRCSNRSCGNWFPSPIFFGDMESFDTATMIGNTVQCPYCSQMVGCNKENMRVISNDGGFRGRDA